PENKSAGRRFDRFDQAILRTCCNEQVVCQTSNSLVMVAVDKNRRLADQSGQTGPALYLDFMRGIGVSGTAVPYGRRCFAIFQQLAAKILIQSSSECDNEELHPAANCQNGKILTKCRAKETDFEVVPFGIHSQD